MDISEKKINTYINLMRISNDENEFQRIPMIAEKILLVKIYKRQYTDIHIAPFTKMENNMGKMAFDQKLHFQFSTVAAITLISRTAIDAGIDPDDAFDLADALLCSLSSAETIDDMHQVFELAAIMFAKKIYQIKNTDFPYHIGKICNYISRNIFHKITINEIAEFVNLSPNYMCNMFSAYMHMTIHNYIQHEKIKISCNLLAQTERPVTEISIYLGYKTVSNFSVTFKKWQGISPTEYRNREFKEVY